MSNTALTLAYGKAQKSFAMDNISNSPVLPEEFERWKKTMEAEFQQFPDADYIEMKAKELDAQRARPNTKEETAVMLSKKKELRSLPTNLAEARAQAVSERERALALGDAAKVEQLDAEIARLDEASRSRVIMSSSMEAFSEINKRNRDRDLKRDALLAEEGRAKQGGFLAEIVQWSWVPILCSLGFVSRPFASDHIARSWTLAGSERLQPRSLARSLASSHPDGRPPRRHRHFSRRQPIQRQQYPENGHSAT